MHRSLWDSVHKETFTQRSLSTGQFCTHRGIYTEKPLHAEPVHSSFYTEKNEKPLRRGAFAHRSVYTFTPESLFSQKLLHTHRSFYTPNSLHIDATNRCFLHRYTETFVYRSFYAEKLWRRKLLHTETFTHRRLYSQNRLHTHRLSHRSFYRQNSHTRKPLWRAVYSGTQLHAGAFRHWHRDVFFLPNSSSYTETRLHREAFTQSSYHTHAQKRSDKFRHRETFTHRGFFTEKSLHTVTFTQSSFSMEKLYTEKLLHRKVLTKKSSLHTGTFHIDAFPCRTVYTRGFCTEAFTQRSFSTQKLLHRSLCTEQLLPTDAFTDRSFYAEKLLHTNAVHRDAFKHRYTHKRFHTEAFAPKNFDTETILNTEAFTHRRL